MRVDDSVSQISKDMSDDEKDLDPRKAETSRDKLGARKQKLCLTNILKGVRLGRSEFNCKAYLQAGKLDDADAALLRQHLKLVARLCSIWACITSMSLFCVVVSECSRYLALVFVCKISIIRFFVDAVVPDMRAWMCLERALVSLVSRCVGAIQVETAKQLAPSELQ